MSDKKGPFDAAIGVLKEYDLFAESHRVRKSCHVSIPVLEAAGKVDGRRAIRTLATLLQVYVEAEGRLIPELEEALRGGAVIEIRALLESLPEK